MTTTFERISAILVREYKLSPDQLTLDAPFEGLGIDSLASVELLWNIEDAFKIKLPPDPVDLPTLGDVVGYVDQIVARQSSNSTPAENPVAQPLQAP